MNDFVAVGYGIELLAPSDLATLQEGSPTPSGPIALIGAGTGLGQGFLLWTETTTGCCRDGRLDRRGVPRGRHRPQILERLKQGPFLTAFRNKGRMTELLSRMPVHAIMNPNVALLGAAAVAGRME